MALGEARYEIYVSGVPDEDICYILVIPSNTKGKFVCTSTPFKALFHDMLLSLKSHILDCNGVWTKFYTKFFDINEFLDQKEQYHTPLIKENIRNEPKKNCGTIPLSIKVVAHVRDTVRVEFQVADRSNSSFCTAMKKLEKEKQEDIWQIHVIH